MRISRQMILIFLLIPIFLLAPQLANSQTSEMITTETPVPSKEVFKNSTEIFIPWREGDCLNIRYEKRDGSGCYIVTSVQYQSHTRLTLFEADASVWRTFDIDHRKPDYFGKIKKEQLIPFATPTLEGNPPWNIVLRANGESEHWYRVIVNEETGDVAYILKTDPEWLKTTFEYWLNGSSILRPLGSFPPLLDAPNGKVIRATEGMIFDQLYFLKLDKPDGEWAYVETPENPIVHKGWIRWRNGRKFLVDCYFSIKTLGQ